MSDFIEAYTIKECNNLSTLGSYKPPRYCVLYKEDVCKRIAEDAHHNILNLVKLLNEAYNNGRADA